MQSTLRETLIVGAAIGLVALLLHTLLDGTPAVMEIAIVVLAGAALGVLQHLLARRRHKTLPRAPRRTTAPTWTGLSTSTDALAPAGRRPTEAPEPVGQPAAETVEAESRPPVL